MFTMYLSRHQTSDGPRWALDNQFLPPGFSLDLLLQLPKAAIPDFLRAFPAGVLNIHPALLPSFPGLHGVRKALDHGVKVTGCTVHLVDEGTDTGPIVAQAAVPVLDGDTEETLAARIQLEEHRLYPLAVRLLATGAVERDGRRLRGGAGPEASGLSLRNPGPG